MLGVGIHENVYLAEATLDENKSVIAIRFKETGKATQVKKSLFERAASSEVEETDDGTQIMLFPPTPPKEGNTNSEEKNVENLVNDINKTKGICLHILAGYLTTEQLKDKMTPFASLPLTETNFNTEIQKKEMLEAAQRNIGRTFIQLITPFLNKPELAFRLLLTRQSTAKHYATLRGRFLNDNPFWESMAIPKEASKVKFTDYEKSAGLDNGAPAAKENKANNSTAVAQAPVTAASIFGNQ